MTFVPNWPPAGLSPKDTVSQINTNFLTFGNNFSNASGGFVYNHINFNVPNQGAHGCVLFDTLGTGNVDPAVTGSWCSLYAKTVKSGADLVGQPELFLRLKQFVPTGLNNVPMQFTYNTVNTVSSQYQSFILGGFLVYWGNGIAATNPVNIVLTPTPTLILNAYATISTGTGTAYISFSNAPPTISVSENGGSVLDTFSWMAIAIA